MTRKEARNELVLWRNRNSDNGYHYKFVEALTIAIKALEQTKWIPVSERLPESEGYGHYFLCCLENGIIRILGYSNILTTRCPKGFYYEEENGTTWRQDINPVIAWMPLPQPYKAESEE